MSTIPRDFITLLLARIDVVDFINQHVPLRKKSGSNYFACCPFHQEKSASFSVSQTKQFYYCFGCGAHGNAIDFIMQQDHLTFPEAIEALAKQYGLTVPKTQGAYQKEDTTSKLYELMAAATQQYQHALKQSSHAMNYLKNRGISSAIAEQFNLGYAPGGWTFLFDLLGKTETDKKNLLDGGLIIKKESGGFYDRFRDRLIFPITDHRGRIIGFGGRVIDQGEPKYLNSPETPLFQKGHELYGLHQTLSANRHLNRILLVEGYMDVIALFQHGISNVVATLGTATTKYHLERLFRYSQDIIFCFDGDAAGRKAALRALPVIFPIAKDGVQIRFLFLPEGEDPDTLIRKEGQSVFEKRIETSLPLSTFFFQSLSEHCDMASVEGRARFAAQALTEIKTLPSGILQSMFLEELSKRARLSLDTLKKGIPTFSTAPTSHPSSLQRTVQIKLHPAVKKIVGLLLQFPQKAHTLPLTFLPSSTQDADLINKIISVIQSEPNMTTGLLLEHFRGQPEEMLLKKLAEWEHFIPDEGVIGELLGAIRLLNALSIDQKINHLLQKSADNCLSDEEKLQLSAFIQEKKTLLEKIE